MLGHAAVVLYVHLYEKDEMSVSGLNSEYSRNSFTIQTPESVSYCHILLMGFY